MSVKWLTISVCLLFWPSFIQSLPASLAKELTHLIFPGTHWCGVGDIAKNINDLGSDSTVDKCCREHDLCPEFIDPGETKYGLKNVFFVSRLHCRCDRAFYNCLKLINTPSSILIGTVYFNALNLPCFMEQCTNNYTLTWGECTTASNQKEKQWFQGPKF